MENGCMDSFHEARRAYSHCALITLSALLLIQGLGLLLSWLIRGLSLRPQDALLITQLPLPLVLIPAYFWLRPKEREAAAPGAIRLEEFPALFLAALPIIYGGNLLGNLLASLLTMGRAVNRLGELSSRMTVPLALYVTCVGPLCEELFFRGMILPRMTCFGQKTALVFSALLFALYPVNLYQFFYAFGLGLLLGALYLKTGSIRMGYVLHAAINLLGGVLPPLLLNLSLGAVAVFGLIMLVLSGFGVMFLLRFKRETVFPPAPKELPPDIGRQAAFRSAGFVLLAILSLAGSLLDLYL